MTILLITLEHESVIKTKFNINKAVGSMWAETNKFHIELKPKKPSGAECWDWPRLAPACCHIILIVNGRDFGTSHLNN